jgi:aspartyl-tRNA(Asn)/glutamyl-tRNA(Gln) amidotransferase subunit A
MSSEMIEACLPTLSCALASKKISAVELAVLFLDRIDEINPTLNAFVSVDRDKTLAQAHEADARRAAGDATALLGIPIAHKDIFCARGWRTTCASKMLENFIAPYDATVVERLNAAGMVTLGKCNMDEFAMGSSNETSYFGPVKNPWNTACVPGGSSGGSAAAVAARLAPVATGTDTGGSIRQPAALCGLTGIKPTYGVASRWGMIAFASSLDQAGPMARTAQDCAWLLNAFCGFDPRDSTSLDRSAEDYARDLDTPLTGLTLGLPRQFFGPGMDDGVRLRVEAALDQYRQLGAQTIDVDLPHSALSVPAYYVLAPAEASSNLSRFDGVRYGFRSDHYDDLLDLYCTSRAQGFGAEVKRRILIGTYVLSHGYYDAYYIKAQKIRRLIANDFAAAFKKCDLIVGPTSPSVAFGLGTKATDPVQMYLSDIYTIAVNLAGLPALSLPCGFDQHLPVGLQLIGPWFSESRLLGAAHQYQHHTDWHLRVPPLA